MHTPAQDADGNDYSGVITPRLSVDDVRQILATQAALKKQLGPSRTPSRPARSKKTPPRDPPCRARRFTPLHAARASLPPCLAAHPVLRKCLAHRRRCLLYPCLSPLVPRRRHAVPRRAPGRARAEASGGGGGEGRRLLQELGCLAQVSPHLVSPPRLAQVAPQEKRRAVSCRSGGASRARARRRLPVAARAGTGASVADATFLVGISSRRSIGASSAPLAPSPPAEVVFWCSPTACPATALDARNPFVQVACCGAPRSWRVLTPDAHPGCARSARVRRSSSATTTASTQWSTQSLLALPLQRTHGYKRIHLLLLIPLAHVH